MATSFAAALASLLDISVTRAADPPRDPLLTAPPPPKRVLENWADAAAILRARSTDLAIAASDVALAEARSRAAVAALLGQIRADGSYTVNVLTQDSAQVSGVTAAGAPTFETLTLPQRTFATGMLTAIVPVIAPRSWIAVQTANVGKDVAAADFLEVQRTLRQSLANAIVGVVVAERTADLSRASLADALGKLDLVTRKKNLGGGTLLDVVRGQQDLEAARAQVVTIDENLRQAREALGLALGLREEVGVSPNLNLDDAVLDVRASCHGLTGLDARADLVAAARRVTLAHQSVRDAKAEFLPTVTLQSAFTATSQDLGAYPQSQWYVQGLLSWNLWDGGTRYADLRSGHARETAEEAREEQARRNATIDVERITRAVSVSEHVRDVTERETAFAADQERLTRLAYETGQGTSLELVAAAAAHRTQEIQLALRQYDVLLAQLNALFAQSNCHL